MRSFTAKRNLAILFFCLLLIIEPIVAMPPQELCTEPCHPYMIVCFASFCLGALLCALINKFCIHHPIAPVMQKLDLEKDLLEQLQKDILAMKTQQEQGLKIVTEQKKTIQELTTNNNVMKLSLCILVTQASCTAAKENNTPLLKKVMKFNQIAYGHTFLPVACYWKNKYTEEKQAFEIYKQQQIPQQTPLLIQEKHHEK